MHFVRRLKAHQQWVGRGAIAFSSFEFSSFLFHKAKSTVVTSLTIQTPPHIKSLAKVVLQKRKPGRAAGQSWLFILCRRDLDRTRWTNGSNLNTCLAHLCDWEKTQQEKQRAKGSQNIKPDQTHFSSFQTCVNFAKLQQDASVLRKFAGNNLLRCSTTKT